MEVVLLSTDIQVNQLEVLQLYFSLPAALTGGAVVPSLGGRPAPAQHTARVARAVIRGQGGVVTDTASELLQLLQQRSQLSQLTVLSVVSVLP